MKMHNHTDFILSPVTDILKNVVSASSGIGSGIETFPLCDYIMQSTFLKMTGFQEQKMKCVIWELATVDYDVRRALLSNDDKLGECSSYEDKNKIFKRLLTQIKDNNVTFDIKSKINVVNIIRESKVYLKELFKDTNLSIWAHSSFLQFSSIEFIKKEHVISIDNKGIVNLFENVLQDKYKVLYNHRNRIAHNTQSYQQNLPTLKTLLSDNYQYENYFLYFFILILIDKIFIILYTEYLSSLEYR